MDLQTTVAASMLPASRTSVAATFKNLRHDTATGAAFLEILWSVAGKREVLGTATLGLLLDSAERALAAAAPLGIEPIPIFDQRYPPLLACIADPPPVLWARGRLDALSHPIVSVVGSRAATPYALEVGARLSGELASRGVAVASGLARGVDSAAHRGCMKAGGITLAVLGSGIDRVYPPEHADLAREIAEHGVVLSELAPGAAPLPEHFPLRNRSSAGSPSRRLSSKRRNRAGRSSRLVVLSSKAEK